MSARVDEGGRVLHSCSVAGCDASAPFGVGVSLLAYMEAKRRGDADAARFLGRWYCRAHLPPDYFHNRDKAHQEAVLSASDSHNPPGRDPAPAKRTQFIKGQGRLL